MKTKITHILFLLFVLSISIHAQVTRTIESIPGGLNGLLGSDKTVVTDLILTGSINDADFTTIKEMTSLKKIDMGAVTVQSGSFPHYVFNKHTFERFILPENLQVLSVNAFWYCTITEGLRLPSGLKTIREGVFAGLTTPFIDFSACQNLESIGYYSFAYTQLGTKRVDLSACDKLTTFTSGYDNQGAFCYFSGDVVLPPNMTHLADNSFANFSGSVQFAEGLKTIGAYAFFRATITEKMILPGTLEEIRQFAFNNTNLIDLDLSLTSHLKTIGRAAFHYTTVPELDFTACTQLETIAAQVFQTVNITSENKLDFRKSTRLTNFDNMYNSGSFGGFSGHVLLPENLKQLNGGAFIGFVGMVTLPDGLEVIGDNSFNGSTISEIDLPVSLASIGANAFNGCLRLKEITSRSTTVPQAGADAFKGVNKNLCTLYVPESSVNLYKTAGGWKDFLNIKPITDPNPDEYQKGKKGNIFVRINTNVYNGKDLMGYDYDKKQQLGADWGHPILKTYNTIEIGESVWTTENIRFKTAYNTWMNHSQQAIDQELGANTLPLDDFEEKFGAFTVVSSNSKVIAYRDNFNVYNQRDGVELQGWSLPAVIDFAQLCGLAPAISDDPIRNIMTFLGVSQEEVPGMSGNHWNGYKNTSGFSMTPLGRRHALEWPNGQYPKLWMNYGRESGFRLKDYPLGMIVFSETDDQPIRVHEVLTHMVQGRYTKQKTDEELGYRLFADLRTDQVLVKPLSQRCNENLRELAPGLTRGVAVRYMKKEEGIVTKSWSEIQAEAEHIRTHIKFLRVPGNNPQQIDLPATDPFRECDSGGYEKGEEGSVFIQINANGNGIEFDGYDFDKEQFLGYGQPILKTYKTIEIGEYVWTQENLRLKNAFKKWLLINQEEIDKELGNKTISLNKFEEKFGSWVSLDRKLTAYKDNFKAYYKRDGLEQQGWDLPTIADFAQLFGQAPAISEDPVKNIMDFLGVPQAEVPGNTGNQWNGYKNISGFSMTPLGRRHALEYPNTQYPKLWYSYGRESAFRLKDRPLGMILFSEVQDYPVHVIDTLTHLCQARYTRKKTDEELGYKLYVDICNDEVVIKPLGNQSRKSQPDRYSGLTAIFSGTGPAINLKSVRSGEKGLNELPAGLERGIALRYADHIEGKVNRKWSEIVAEGMVIRQRLKNIPIPSLPSMHCNPEGGIELMSLQVGTIFNLEWYDEHDNPIVVKGTWISSNPAVGRIENNDKLIAISIGTTIVSFIFEDGHKEDLLEITVYKGELPKPGLPADQNYIRTITYTQAMTTPNEATKDGVIDQVQYFDGLGRPVQNVYRNITPLGNDLVTHLEYDAFGRDSIQWLPVPVHKDNGGGFFVFNDQVKSQVKSIIYEDDNPYSQPVYEASPLNRIVEQYGPGEEWYTSKASVKTAYLTNNASDLLSCIQYTVTGTRDNPGLNKGPNYPTGELYVTQMTDEEGNESYEFKDKLGQAVLTRQIGDNDKKHDTYYVYDDYGNLYFVLPPRINEEGTTQVKLDELAYQYKYDERNRCTGKKIPGAEWVKFVYDKADRLIFTQDGEQKLKNQWLFTISDALGRIALTGICTNDVEPDVIKATLVSATATSTGAYEGYSLNGTTLDNAQILTVNYYDWYVDGTTNPRSEFTQAGLGYDNARMDYPARHESAKGLLTATKVLTLTPNQDDEQFLLSALYYDEKARLVQTHSTNHLKGIDSEYVAYNFTGQPTQRLHVHKAESKNDITELYGYEYDHSGRLKQTTHQLTEGTTVKPKVILAENQYDELGRLISTTANQKEDLLKTDYYYNIRSWTGYIENHHYKQGMDYTLNGNVNRMDWTQNGQEKQLYSFEYDKLSRLTAANYNDDPNGLYSTAYAYDMHGNMLSLTRRGTTNTRAPGVIDELEISHTGNQLKRVEDHAIPVLRSGSQNFLSDAPDAEIQYSYNANGAMSQDLNKGISNIAYNPLNLPQVMDINASGSEARTRYTYSASGQKLKVYYKWNSNRENTPLTGADLKAISGVLPDESRMDKERVMDYSGNMVYEDGRLKMIVLGNAYYDNNEKSYYFYITDHLGNNRIVTDAGGANVVQSNEYYPFGMEMYVEGVSQQSDQPFKYNGKEQDNIHGLGLYDYAARYYDYIIPHFPTQDPLAENKPWLSPYVYCSNNPIIRIDPNGMADISKLVKGTHYGIIAVFPTEPNRDRKINDDYKAALEAGIGTMEVKDIEDFAKGMSDMAKEGITTDNYSLNNHGGPGYFYLGRIANENKITNSPSYPFQDLSILKDGLSGKSIFIGACAVTLDGNKRGIETIERLSNILNATIISSDHNLATKFKYDGSDYLSKPFDAIRLELNPGLRNVITNTYHLASPGEKAMKIYDFTIDSNGKFSWKTRDED